MFMTKLFFITVVVGASGLFGLTVRAETMPGELIVTFREPTSGIFRQGSATRVLGLKGREKLQPLSGQTFLVRTESENVVDLAQRLRRNVRVEQVQPNYVYHALFVPNDPSYRYQWNFETVRAPAGWDFDATAPLYGGDASILVAVLDTGAAYEDFGDFKKAPDFAGTTFVAGQDFVNNDTHPNDDNGHGTHVTMTIAESTNNGLAAAGLAFASSIMPIKVLDGSGLGSTATIAAGVDFARLNGAKVINLSLGGTNDDPLLHQSIQNAVNAGIVVVAATGNDGAGSVYYPARYDEVIAVGATRYDNLVTTYSNFGTGIDLVAPGGDLDVDQNGDGQPDGIVQQTCETKACATFNDFFYEGTSQAAPHVSATASLLLAAGVQGANVKTVLEGSAKDLGAGGYDSTYGYGLLDISAALTLGLNDKNPPTGSITINNGSPYTNVATVTINVKASDPEGTGILMSFSNDGISYSAWQTLAATKSAWDLTTFGGSSLEGPRTVYARFKDAAGNASSAVSAQVTLDQTPPPAPTLDVHAPPPNDQVKLLSGVATSVKDLVAAWNEPSDNLSGIAGYRLDFTPQSEPDFSVIPVTTERTYAAATQSSSRVLYLHVVAVDQAGNVSATRTFTYVYQLLRVVAGTRSQGAVVSFYTPTGSLKTKLQPLGKASLAGVRVAVMTYELGRPDALLVGSGSGQTIVKVVSADGQELSAFKPYGARARHGVNVAAGDFQGDGRSEIAVAPQSGALPIRIFTNTGEFIREFFPFGKKYSGGVSVSTGDVDGDSTQELIVSQMVDKPLVRIFSAGGQRLKEFRAFPKGKNFGIHVASGDVDGDGRDEIVASPVAGSSQVVILMANGKRVSTLTAFSKKYRGGINVSTGDVDGDGRDEVMTVPVEGYPKVQLFTGQGKFQKSFYAIGKSFRGGVQLTTIR